MRCFSIECVLVFSFQSLIKLSDVRLSENDRQIMQGFYIIYVY